MIGDVFDWIIDQLIDKMCWLFGHEPSAIEPMTCIMCGKKIDNG